MTAQDRVHLLDEAQVPDTGSPGPKTLFLFVVIVTVFALALVIVTEGLLLSFQKDKEVPLVTIRLSQDKSATLDSEDSDQEREEAA